MNERLGVFMRTAQAFTGLLDVFHEDPDTALAIAAQSHCKAELLDALLQDHPEELEWIFLLRIADTMEADSHEAFRRIAQLASEHLCRTALSAGIMEYAATEDLILPKFEHELRSGTFNAIIQEMPRQVIMTLCQYPLGKTVVPIFASKRIEHFLENGDLKRAYDELVAAATAIDNWRPPMFEKWIERVWTAHRAKNLVTDLTDDPNDWRNCTMQIEIRYGQAHTGFRTTKPKKPKVHSMKTNVPMVPLWGLYTGSLPDVHDYAKHWIPVQRAEHGSAHDASWRTVYFPVSRIGAMLRDMITHWYLDAKERKLREFCTEHKIDYPPPT